MYFNMALGSYQAVRLLLLHLKKLWAVKKISWHKASHSVWTESSKFYHALWLPLTVLQYKLYIKLDNNICIPSFFTYNALCHLANVITYQFQIQSIFACLDLITTSNVYLKKKKKEFKLTNIIKNTLLWLTKLSILPIQTT